MQRKIEGSWNENLYRGGGRRRNVSMWLEYLSNTANNGSVSVDTGGHTSRVVQSTHRRLGLVAPSNDGMSPGSTQEGVASRREGGHSRCRRASAPHKHLLPQTLGGSSVRLAPRSDRQVPDDARGGGGGQHAREQSRPHQRHDRQRVAENPARRGVAWIRRVDPLQVRLLAYVLFRVGVFVHYVPPQPRSPPNQNARHGDRVQRPEPSRPQSPNPSEGAPLGGVLLLQNLHPVDEALGEAHPRRPEEEAGRGALRRPAGEEVVIQHVPRPPPEGGGTHADADVGEDRRHVEGHEGSHDDDDDRKKKRERVDLFRGTHVVDTIERG
jgi:hypothetical protein